MKSYSSRVVPGLRGNGDEEDEDAERKKHYKCSKCPSTFAHTKSLLTHTRRHENIFPYRCGWPKCPARYVTRTGLTNHIRRIHFKVPRNQKKQDGKLNGLDNRDPGLFVIRDEQYLTQPDRTRSKKKDEMEIPEKKETKIHEKQKNEKKSKDDKNGHLFPKSTTTKPTPQAEKPSANADKPFVCHFNQFGVCNSFFRTEKNLHTHYRYHLSIKPYSCAYPSCTENFRAEVASTVRLHVQEKHLQSLGNNSDDPSKYVNVQTELLCPVYANLPN